MAVYVDDMRTVMREPSGKSHRWHWDSSCHLWADEEEELIEFAIRLGLEKRWIQRSVRLVHFDLTKHMRDKAIVLGAQPVGAAGLKDYFRSRRKINGGAANGR